MQRVCGRKYLGMLQKYTGPPCRRAAAARAWAMGADMEQLEIPPSASRIVAELSIFEASYVSFLISLPKGTSCSSVILPQQCRNLQCVNGLTLRARVFAGYCTGSSISKVLGYINRFLLSCPTIGILLVVGWDRLVEAR